MVIIQAKSPLEVKKENRLLRQPRSAVFSTINTDILIRQRYRHQTDNYFVGYGFKR